MSILTCYCAITGYFPDECVGAKDAEMEQDIIAAHQALVNENNRLGTELARLKLSRGDVCR